MDQLTHKTILITGATSGIGKAIAEGFAHNQAKLILIYRNLNKAMAVKQQIINKTGNHHIELYYADFTKLSSIKALFDQGFNHKIDIICNCAGALFSKRQLTEDGFESNFSVNYLASFYLTKMIIDSQMEHPTTIINLAGELHRRFSIDINDLQHQHSFNFIKAGSIGMLQRVLFTKSLTMKYNNVRAYSYHPGLIRTALLNELPFYLKYPAKLISPFFSTPKVGADTAIWLGISHSDELINGAYYFKRKELQPSQQALDSQLQEQLWEKSNHILKKYY